MNTSLIHEAKEILEDLRNMKRRMDKQLASLDSYGAWKLKRNSPKQSKHCYYDAILPGSKKGKYLGNESNETVLNVKRYRYAKKAVEIIETDIEVLERLIGNYISPDYSNINSCLPATYRTELTADNSDESFSTALPPEAIRWIQALKEENHQTGTVSTDFTVHQIGAFVFCHKPESGCNLMTVRRAFVGEAQPRSKYPPSFVQGFIIIRRPDYILIEIFFEFGF